MVNNRMVRHLPPDRGNYELGVKEWLSDTWGDRYQRQVKEGTCYSAEM